MTSEIGVIYKLESLSCEYGDDITLGELIKRKKGNNIHKCPKCEGHGYVTRCIPGDWGYTGDRYVDEKCDLCKGIGYTEHEYKPRMVQDGWEQECD